MVYRDSRSFLYNSIWLSDLHLGTRNCKADLLLEFLSHTRCKTLYLIGDVLDIISLKRQWYWDKRHTDVIRKLLSMAEQGTRIIYIAGNHDAIYRRLHDRSFGSIRFERQVAHTTNSGERLLVTHGDEFEHSISLSGFTKVVGYLSYDLLLFFNRVYNRVREWRGKPYWSLAAFIKSRVGNVRRAIESFEQAAINYAKSHGFDGVICGHLHQPRICRIDGALYCNDGDWVENCTAVAEGTDGRFELLHWNEMRQSALANENIATRFDKAS